MKYGEISGSRIPVNYVGIHFEFLPNVLQMCVGVHKS